jgi:hypothetical protein
MACRVSIPRPITGVRPGQRTQRAGAPSRNTETLNLTKAAVLDAGHFALDTKADIGALREFMEGAEVNGKEKS